MNHARQLLQEPFPRKALYPTANRLGTPQIAAPHTGKPLQPRGKMLRKIERILQAAAIQTAECMRSASPAGATQDSPGREPWERNEARSSPAGATQDSPGREPWERNEARSSPAGATQDSPGREPWGKNEARSSPAGATHETRTAVSPSRQLRRAERREFPCLRFLTPCPRLHPVCLGRMATRGSFHPSGTAK